jgi:hypothetical protein
MPRTPRDGAASAMPKFVALTRCHTPTRTPKSCPIDEVHGGEVHDQTPVAFISDHPDQSVAEHPARGYVNLTGHRNHGDAALQPIFNDEPLRRASCARRSFLLTRH